MAVRNFVNLKAPGDSIGNQNSQNVSTSLQGIVDVINNLKGEPWHEIGPTDFKNGWVNFGGGYATAAYYKDVLGIVHLRGLIKSGTTATAAFYLPSGYRPRGALRNIVESNGVYGQLILNGDGGVIPNTASNVYFALDFVNFRAEL